jgi:fermentation-respiration switch protein FrsA (DUF1100 family)
LATFDRRISLRGGTMHVLKIITSILLGAYSLVIVLLYVFQSRLIFYPGKLSPDFKFAPESHGEEVFVDTSDGERINALFFPNTGKGVILYFHGNAGDLGGWQFVAQDFSATEYNFMIIDYRGYGKSSGEPSEHGFYVDAEAAYDYLIKKGFDSRDILIYGRSVGSGVAVDLAAKKPCQGLILESAYSSMGRLANEKFPFFFPSLFLRYRFDNLQKINRVKSPVIFLHGSRDTLIPPAHSHRLFEKFAGKKQLIMVNRGGHNDLNVFDEYARFLKDFPAFFV